MVLVSVRDLLFRSKIQEAAARAGVPFRFAPRGAALAEAVRETGGSVLLVDLNQPGALDEVRAARGAGASRIVGFLGHLQAELMEQAAAEGVEVLTRGQLVSRLDELLRGAAAGEPGTPPAP
jgi:hypothetical protein